MSQIRRFEDIEIWQKSIEIALDIYKLSEEGKLKSDFGFKDQIRRAAMSISNNIAEGFEYDNNRHFVKFLHYSKGSAGEVRSQLFVLWKINYIKEESYKNIHDRLIELSKKISGFIKYLKEFEKNNSNL